MKQAVSVVLMICLLIFCLAGCGQENQTNLCGIAAGLLIRFLYRNKPFFNFDGFEEPKSHDTAFAAMAVGGYADGKCGCIYDNRSCDKNNESWRIENRTWH